jgi:Bacterial toxin 28
VTIPAPKEALLRRAPTPKGARSATVLDEVSVASPRLAPTIDRLRRRLVDKSGEISLAAATAKVSIQVTARVRRQRVQAASTSLETALDSICAAGNAAVSAAIRTKQTAIETECEKQKSIVRASVSAEERRLSTEAATIAASVRESGRIKAQAAHDLGEAQATRASGEVSRQATAARRKGADKASSIRDADRERADVQQQAVREVAEELVRQIEKSGPDLSQFARETATEISSGFSEQSMRAALEIEKTANDAQPAVHELVDIPDAPMDSGAKTALDSLAMLESHAVEQFGTLRAEAAANARAIVTDLTPQIDATEQAALDETDSMVTDAQAALDTSAQETARILARRHGKDAEAAALASGFDAIDGISAQVSMAFRLAGTQTDQLLAGIEGAATTGVSDVETAVSAALVKAKEGVGAGAEGIASNAQQGFRMVASEATKHAADAVDRLLAEFRGTGQKTSAEFDRALQAGTEKITAAIDKPLRKNDESLSELDAKMSEAAAKAAEEYDRPWWKKALYALGKAVLYIALAIVATLALALLIFAVAWLLAAAGIIGAITFATALAIAVVVAALGFVVYEFVQRLRAYKAEHGEWPGFWTGAAILGISLLSLTGIPQIIEGIRGKRFFSDKQLSSQERYDLVIGGILQLGLLVFGGKIFRALRSRGEPTPSEQVPPAKPGPPAEPAQPEPGEQPRPAPIPRQLGLRQQALDAIESLENIKQDPVGPDPSGGDYHNHYSAARREAAGEVVARRPDGRPYSHISDLQQACDGLFNVRDALAREAANPPDTMTPRGLDVLLARLSEVNRLINRLAGFLNEIGYGRFPPYHQWPPGS